MKKENPHKMVNPPPAQPQICYRIQAGRACGNPPGEGRVTYTVEGDFTIEGAIRMFREAYPNHDIDAIFVDSK